MILALHLWDRIGKASGKLIIGLAILSWGCVEKRGMHHAERSGAYGPVALGPGDVVKLAFSGAPEYNQAQKVRADGRLSLPLVGEVVASGKNLGAFQRELSERYKTQLQNTEVMVALESSAMPVLVSGAVVKPGRIQCDRPLTVLDALMEAGGIAPVGDPKRVHVIRVRNGEHQTEVMDLRPILRGEAGRAFYVKGGDVIYVEESLF